jgi:hypothetical protein
MARWSAAFWSSSLKTCHGARSEHLASSAVSGSLAVFDVAQRVRAESAWLLHLAAAIERDRGGLPQGALQGSRWPPDQCDSAVLRMSSLDPSGSSEALVSIWNAIQWR